MADASSTAMTTKLMTPTGYVRGAAGFSNPLGGGLTTGIDGQAAVSQLTLPSPFEGGIRTLYTNRVTPNTGFVSNTSLTNTLGVAKETMEPDDIYVDTLLFADNRADPARTGHRTSKHVMNLHKVNRYLASEEGRRRYGHYRSYHAILRDFRFQGYYKAGASDWQKSSTHELEITTVVMGRMRVKDLFQAQLSSRGAGRKIHGIVNERDYAWLILVRCKLPDEIADMVAQAEEEASMDEELVVAPPGKKRRLTGSTERIDREDDIESSSVYSKQRRLSRSAEPEKTTSTPSLPGLLRNDPYPYYWKYEIVTTRDRSKPPLYVWSCDSEDDDNYTGFCQFIGTIGDTRGSRKANKALTYNARKAIAGDDLWKDHLNPLPFIDIHATVK